MTVLGSYFRRLRLPKSSVTLSQLPYPASYIARNKKTKPILDIVSLAMRARQVRITTVTASPEPQHTIPNSKTAKSADQEARYALSTLNPKPKSANSEPANPGSRLRVWGLRLKVKAIALALNSECEPFLPMYFQSLIRPCCYFVALGCSGLESWIWD